MLSNLLKPCPFCGNTDIHILQMIDSDLMTENSDPEEWFVICSLYEKGCGTSSKRAKFSFEVLEAWNKRQNE